jgi:hypothetical protein
MNAYSLSKYLDTPRARAVLAHDAPTCQRFGEKIMHARQ